MRHYFDKSKDLLTPYWSVQSISFTMFAIFLFSVVSFGCVHSYTLNIQNTAFSILLKYVKKVDIWCNLHWKKKKRKDAYVCYAPSHFIWCWLLWWLFWFRTLCLTGQWTGMKLDHPVIDQHDVYMFTIFVVSVLFITCNTKRIFVRVFCFFSIKDENPYSPWSLRCNCRSMHLFLDSHIPGFS